jgi:hypothetical protein
MTWGLVRPSIKCVYIIPFTVVRLSKCAMDRNESCIKTIQSKSQPTEAWNEAKGIGMFIKVECSRDPYTT